MVMLTVMGSLFDTVDGVVLRWWVEVLFLSRVGVWCACRVNFSFLSSSRCEVCREDCLRRTGHDAALHCTGLREHARK